MSIVADTDLRQLEQTMAGGVADAFEIDVSRVSVRATWTLNNEAEPEGKGSLRFFFDVDGKTPPTEMCEVIESTFALIAAIAGLKGIPVAFTSGVTEPAGGAR